jgi:hypothetical protein
MTPSAYQWLLLLAIKWWIFAMFASATLFGTCIIIERGGGKGGWGYRYRRWSLHFVIASVAILSIVRRSAVTALRTLLHSN